MKHKIIFILFCSIDVFSNEGELIDIKPIYRSYNLGLIIPLIILFLIIFSFFVYKLFKRISLWKKRDKKIQINWNILLDELKSDHSLSPRQIESELFRILKLFIKQQIGISVDAQLDNEFINQVNQENKFSASQKQILVEFIGSSTELRFADIASQREIVIARVLKVKEIFSILDNKTGESK